jgi:predicted DNA-binding protein (MmcQ/YjbR family)
MTLEDALARTRESCLQHGGAYEKISHGTSAFFVEKGKQFVAFEDNHHGSGRLALWILALPTIQELLIQENPDVYFRPPYVGVKGWIGVCLDQGLDWETIDDLVAEGYKLACPIRKRPRSRSADREV